MDEFINDLVAIAISISSFFVIILSYTLPFIPSGEFFNVLEMLLVITICVFTLAILVGSTINDVLDED